jgi:hypothetical protein
MWDEVLRLPGAIPFAAIHVGDYGGDDASPQILAPVLLPQPVGQGDELARA